MYTIRHEHKFFFLIEHDSVPTILNLVGEFFNGCNDKIIIIMIITCKLKKYCFA